MAAQLGVGVDAFISHSSAAVLLELDGYNEGPIELSTTTGRARKGIKLHRIPKVRIPRLRTIQGFRVTWPERTLLDLAAASPIDEVGRAMDDSLRSGKTTLDRLHAELTREQGPGRRGISNFRKLIEARDGRDERLRSTFEARMLRILKRIETHVVVPDYRVDIGARHYFLDFAYPDFQVGIECHSVKWHPAHRWKDDVQRDRALSRAGYDLHYFTWHEVHFAAEQIREDVIKALASAAA